MKRRVMLVVRTPADESRLDGLRETVSALRGDGHRITVRMTFEAGDARRFARGAALRGMDLVIAAGGDGTVNEVVNGLTAASQDTALGVVPLGTANDFARGLGLPMDANDALRLAVTGRAVPVDIATVNRRAFINVSTGGFGAAATRSVSRTFKRRLGTVAYLMSSARKLVQMEPARAVFRAEGEVVHDGTFVFFAVGNSRLTGGGMRIAPRADTDDGKLDLIVVGGVGRLGFLRLLPRLRAGTHLSHPAVRHYRADSFEVLLNDPVRVNADGEPVAGRSFRYELLGRTLRVVVPDC
jgi:lipid kinase YegS